MDWLKLLNHKIQHARELSTQDWRTLIEAWLILLSSHIALLAQSYQRLDDSIHAADSLLPRESRAQEIAEANQLHQSIHYAAKLHLIPMTCLIKSLALKKMLGRRNVSAHIKIGARKDFNILRAHAWVEVHQMPIGEAEDVTAKFSPFVFANLNN